MNICLANTPWKSTNLSNVIMAHGRGVRRWLSAVGSMAHDIPWHGSMAARLAVRCAAIASPGIWLMAVYCSEWVASQPSRMAVMEWPKMTGNPNIKWPAVAQTSRHCIRRGIYHRNVEWNDWNVWYAQHLPLCRSPSDVRLRHATSQHDFLLFKLG